MLARPGSHSTNANAAVNLARWGEKHHLDPRTPNSGAEPPTPADRTAPTRTPCALVKPARRTRELTLIPHQRA